MTAACIPIQHANPFFRPRDRGVSDDAKNLSSIVEELLEDCSPSVIIGGREVLQELFELWEECSVENWDGYGAQPIDPDSFYEAERFVLSLPTLVPKPEIHADPDGEVSFEWYIEPRKVFSVSIGRRNEVTFAGLFGTNKSNGREYFGDEIPKAIMDNLDRLFAL